MKTLQRCEAVLRDAVDLLDINTRFNPLSIAIAKMSVGEKPEEKYLYNELDTLYRKFDCGDFSISLIVRMLNLYGDAGLLSDKMKADIKKELLRYDYWYDVENIRFPGHTIMWTENHVFYFKCDQFLVGKYYKDDIFKTGKTGTQMAAEVRAEVLDWMDIKLKTGFCEWDSSSYTGCNIKNLLNLYDFADDVEIKQKAKQLLDVIMFSIAIHSFDGYACSCEGRTYTANLLKESNGLASVKYILWNKPDYFPSDVGVCLATSQYEGFEKADAVYGCTKTFESFEQQGFYVEDGPLLGRGYTIDHDLELYWQNMGYTHKLTLENNIKMGEKYNIQINHQLNSKYKDYQDNPQDEISIRGACYLGRANTVLYKTKDYAISSVQDYRKGEEGFQQHVWQATFPKGTIVFTSNPGSMGKGDARPDFWAGNAEHPRVLQYKDTVICIYNLSEKVKYPYSHGYFPKNEMDEAFCVGNYAFGRKGDSYISLYSSGSMTWGEGENACCELICKSASNIWICQMGSKEQFGSFEQYVAQVLMRKISVEGLSVVLNSQYGKITAGWDDAFCLNDEMIPTRDFKRFDNPFCVSEYMSGEYKFL